MSEFKKYSSQILILTIGKTMNQKSKNLRADATNTVEIAKMSTMAGTIVYRIILAIGVPICSRYNDNSPDQASFRI